MQKFLRHPLSRWILKSLTLSVGGLSHINSTKNYIFAMNHQSVIDVPIAYSLISLYNNNPLSILMSHRFYRFLWPLVAPLGTISVDMNHQTERGRIYNNRMLKAGLEKLKQRKNILIYPEGIISGGVNSHIIKGYTGAVRLAIQSGKPIIPIGVSGSNLAYPFLLKTRNPFKLKRKTEIKITFGPEIKLDQIRHLDLDIYSEDNRKRLRSETEALMLRLSDLSGLPYLPDNLLK